MVAPAAAGFIAEGSDPQTWDAVTAAVLAALSAEFTVLPERDVPGGSERRATRFDTFDWRLHKAGLILEYVSARAGGELRLHEAGRSADAVLAQAGLPSPAATQSVQGWQASRPHRLGDLGDGPVAARIARLMAPRALVPVVTVGSATTVYRLLNDDRKTVARLLVSRSRLVTPPFSAQPGTAQRETAPRETVATELAPRLVVGEVRGYLAQARRAARLLAAVPGLAPEAEPRPDAALRALGRRPGDYSNKVDAAITAAMPAGQAGAAILLRLLDTIEVNVPGTLADTDTEFLHDLRVSVRRTRSAVKLLGDSLAGFTPSELAFFAAEFKWVGDLTTPTRDLDVHLLDFEDTARGLTAAKPDDLEPFRAYLEQRRRREFRALTRGLRSARFTALTRDWRARLVQASPVSPGTAGLLAAERTRVAFARVAKRGAAISPDSPAESLHDLRKRCKELRYALEFFAPLHEPAAYAKVTGDLKRLQDCLGDFQDTEIQIGEIRVLAAAMLAQGEAPAVTLLAMGEITAGLAARQRAARADFERRFAAFAGIEGQRRVSALLRGRHSANADIRGL
jgi:CHAD domain-containing protein